jgi:nucleoside-diphosphate-sugar epimerase
MSTVLVTGGSGFVGSHVVLQALAACYEVRTTVRSLKKEAAVRETLALAGAQHLDRLSFHAADLTRDEGWGKAAAGCDYLLHVASPFPLADPAHEDELIIPARNGTLRALRAAREAGVKRAVVTSSFAAIGYGHGNRQQPFTEADWTDLSGHVPPYMKSKTIAERAAWDFVADEGAGLELATVNPVAIFGPALNDDLSGSVELVQRLLKGSLPGLPRLSFVVVDVRDVADLHLRSMTHPAAAGERFLAISGGALWLSDIAAALKEGLGADARKVPTRVLPDWMVRVVGLVGKQARAQVPNLGLLKDASGTKAETLLGWEPRPAHEAIVATGESLVRLGLV